MLMAIAVQFFTEAAKEGAMQFYQQSSAPDRADATEANGKLAKKCAAKLTAAWGEADVGGMAGAPDLLRDVTAAVNTVTTTSMAHVDSALQYVGRSG